MQKINDFMISMLARVQGAGRDEEGQTLVEYGLIIALLSIVSIAILATLGGQIRDVFTTVSDELGGAGT